MDKTAYFKSRQALGRDFAWQLYNYSGLDTSVLAVSEGGAAIAVEIAKHLDCPAALLALKHIYLPGEHDALGVVDESGRLTYGQNISKAFIEEYEMEFRTTIESDKMTATHELHAGSKTRKIDPQMFKDKNVIIVNDFSKTGTSFKAATDFLKPVGTKKLILVAAVAQVRAIDMMHLSGDKLITAHTTDKDFPPEHYFENDESDQALDDLLEARIWNAPATR